jgi:hypothetical protein
VVTLFLEMTIQGTNSDNDPENFDHEAAQVEVETQADN